MVVNRTPAQPAQKSMTLDTLIELFITTKQVEARSPSTLSWYRRFLEGFAAFLVENGGQATLDDVTLVQARAFIGHLQARTSRYENHAFRSEIEGGLSSRTIHAYVRVLKVFGNWLHEEGFVNASPFERLKRPKLGQTMIQVLSDDEIRRLIGCIKPDTVLGARAHAMVLLLLDTGIRASELCSLKMSDTDLKQGSIKVMGKGRKERMVPFGGMTKKSLIRYIHAYRREPASEEIDRLFLSEHGTQIRYEGLAQVIRRLAKAADIPRLHAHLFRHTFAVRYLMNGAM